jgi:hypothetical protein
MNMVCLVAERSGTGKQESHLSSWKGTTVALPAFSLWGVDHPPGYDDVKTKKGHLLFRVVSPYRGKRLALCAIGKNGRTHTRKERFTITPEQAMEWKADGKKMTQA